MVSRAIALCGTEHVDPPTADARAGPLRAEFDNGALRYIRVGGVEVLRAIAFLVRDENWGTFSPEITQPQHRRNPALFRSAIAAAVPTQRASWSTRRRSPVGATARFPSRSVAEPKTDVLTNRTGFIVLHPVEGVAGHPVKVLHVDGREQRSTFPETIDPRCPFKDVRALSHEIAPDTWATCTMEGDAYETEDQRNWSDASYKTYIRPLTSPGPTRCRKARRFSSRSNCRFPEACRTASGAADGPVLPSRVGGEIGKLPAIGLGVPADEAAHALANADLLKRLSPRWLICQVDLRSGHGRAELERYRALGELTGAEIMLEIVTLGTLDPAAEFAPVAKAAADAGLKPAAVAVFPAQDMVSVQPDAPWPEMPSFDETYAAARNAFPGVKLGGGMAAYFTELNRKRPPSALLDFVTHTTCPNVHAADDRSVMETNEAIPFQILTTRSFMGDMPYRIGPSQLGCRENPYGRTTAPNAGNSRVCLSLVDPRQRGIYNAAWTVAYVAACARGGVEASPSATHRPLRPHLPPQAGSAHPWFDGLDRPERLPRPSMSSPASPPSPAQRSFRPMSPRRRGRGPRGARRRQDVLWLANLTGDPVDVELAADLADARIVTLDPDAFEELTRAPDYLEHGRPRAAGRPDPASTPARWRGSRHRGEQHVGSPAPSRSLQPSNCPGALAQGEGAVHARSAGSGGAATEIRKASAGYISR